MTHLNLKALLRFRHISKIEVELVAQAVLPMICNLVKNQKNLKGLHLKINYSQRTADWTTYSKIQKVIEKLQGLRNFTLKTNYQYKTPEFGLDKSLIQSFQGLTSLHYETRSVKSVSGDKTELLETLKNSLKILLQLKSLIIQMSVSKDLEEHKLIDALCCIRSSDLEVLYVDCDGSKWEHAAITKLLESLAPKQELKFLKIPICTDDQAISSLDSLLPIMKNIQHVDFGPLTESAANKMQSVFIKCLKLKKIGFRVCDNDQELRSITRLTNLLSLSLSLSKKEEVGPKRELLVLSRREMMVGLTTCCRQLQSLTLAVRCSTTTHFDAQLLNIICEFPVLLHLTLSLDHVTCYGEWDGGYDFYQTKSGFSKSEFQTFCQSLQQLTKLETLHLWFGNCIFGTGIFEDMASTLKCLKMLKNLVLDWSTAFLDIRNEVPSFNKIALQLFQLNYIQKVCIYIRNREEEERYGTQGYDHVLSGILFEKQRETVYKLKRKRSVRDIFVDIFKPPTLPDCYSP